MPRVRLSAEAPLTTQEQEMVTANVGLAYYMCNCFRNAHRTWRVVCQLSSDLESVALYSLMQAVRYFDPERGIKFASYASVVMWRNMKAAVRSEMRKGSKGYVYSINNNDKDDGIGDIPDVDYTDQLSGVDAAKLHNILSRLPARTLHILRLRFWEGLTLQEVGTQLGVSRQRILQVQSSAKKYIQRYFKGSPL